MTANLTAIDPSGTRNVIRLSSQRIDLANQMLQWCWVSSLEMFVLMDDPSKRRTEKMFNDIYLDAFPQSQRRGSGRGQTSRNITPSSYIRQEHRSSRVVDRLEMLPGCSERIVEHDYGLKVLNLYRPPPGANLPEADVPEGSADQLLEHIHWIVNGDEGSFRHLMNWIAHLVFRPEQRIHHGVVISGKQGTGKSTIGDIISALLGSSSRKIHPRYLKADFQDWMLDTRFVVVEELKEMGNETLYNSIKPLFTDDQLHINPKGLPSFDITNHLHFLMFSNHPYPMALEEGDRRLFYVHSEVDKKDEAYYADLHDHIHAPGTLNAFSRYLRDEVAPNLPDRFAFTAPPRTAHHEKWIDASKNPIETFIEEQRGIAERMLPGYSIFAPQTIFYWTDLKDALAENHGHILRNTTATESALTKCGVVKERRTINGSKLTMGWFKEYDNEMRELLSDTSKAGRERLDRHLYLNPLSAL